MWQLMSLIFIVSFVGPGIVGSYRALKNKSDLFTKWHVFVFLGSPIAGLYYSYSDLPYNLIALLVMFFAFPLWLFSSFEVYNATEEKPRKTTASQYFTLLAQMSALLIVLVIAMHFIASNA